MQQISTLKDTMFNNRYTANTRYKVPFAIVKQLRFKHEKY